MRVAKTLAGVVDLKRVGNDAFRVAGAMILCFVMSMFEGSDAESLEGLQISCHGSVTLQGSFRVAVTGLFMPRLNLRVAGAVLLKHALQIIKTYCNSEVKRLVDMLFLKEVSQKSFVFDLQNFIFEGSLVQKLRFLSFFSFKASFLKEVSCKSFVFLASKYPLKFTPRVPGHHFVATDHGPSQFKLHKG